MRIGDLPVGNDWKVVLFSKLCGFSMYVPSPFLGHGNDKKRRNTFWRAYYTTALPRELETFSSDLGEDLYESKKVLEITIKIRYLFL